MQMIKPPSSVTLHKFESEKRIQSDFIYPGCFVSEEYLRKADVIEYLELLHKFKDGTGLGKIEEFEQLAQLKRELGL